MRNQYESPLNSRYASDEMQRLFSPDMRYSTWRKLWVSLARAEHALGLPVSQEQVDELAAHTEDIDYDVVAKREAEVRHDVMAHVYAYGQVCPKAAGIIHLGATSCYVTDNADLVILRDALLSIRNSIYAVLKPLSTFAEQTKTIPTVGYTHYQHAQPVTVGRRAALWLQDLWLDLEEIEDTLSAIRFLGCRGATGTEASFVSLFGGDSQKIDALNERIAADFGFTRCYDVSGQTYPRKLDSRVLNALSSVAQSAYKFGDDMRLLQHDGILSEPFESKQIGSSAMAYKQNPMRSERICSLSRFVMATSLNASMTASTQWLERTLDDSANRRLSLPEAFLATDAVLRLMANICSGIVVHEQANAKMLANALPFLATENLLMAAVKRGGDRQALHEIIRTHSLAAKERLASGEGNDLAERLGSDPAFPLSVDEIRQELDPMRHIGRSIEQTNRFLAGHPVPESKPLQEIMV
ncbi:MAG: adenylosuccinate lyase [Firmicutes bacterium HGW-Firmicutes-9]|jgi:adenylosuccinate lyase|nr:MAG: adenylosuccinate lyase [Firmicutes bacterium HGW-Firmicutes-9]